MVKLIGMFFILYLIICCIIFLAFDFFEFNYSINDKIIRSTISAIGPTLIPIIFIYSQNKKSKNKFDKNI
jgi:uncharacterized membrane protein